jgi:hypothetical protein
VTAAEILRRAADVLRRDGWCQGDMRRADGHRCMAGAVIAAMVTVDGHWSRAIEHAFFSVIGTHDRTGWNDTPGRTAAEVIAALEAAAVLAESEAAE